MKRKNKIKIPKDAFCGQPDIFLFSQWFITYVNKVYRKLGISEFKQFNPWRKNEEK